MTTRNAMRTGSATLAGLALVLFALAAVPRIVLAADEVTDANVAERIERATTQADHVALATYFREKAAEAGKRAELHEKMLASIKRWESGKVQAKHSVHCGSLIRAARDAQTAYQKLADDEAEMAKGAAK